MPEAVMTLQHQRAVETHRSAVLVQMLVVVAVELREDDDGELRLRSEQKLSQRMLDMPGSRSAFGGTDVRRNFRLLAWDAAKNLTQTSEGEDAIKLARILREILKEIPECDALAA